MKVAHAEEVPLEQKVGRLVDQYGVSRELVFNIIECESRWNPNADNGEDRGLWQFNRKWRPDVSDEVAFDPIASTHVALKDIKAGYAHRWVCANCYAYIKAYYYKDLPRMAEIAPNTIPSVGAVAIFQYEVKHLAYVSELQEKGFTVKEANYEPGKIAERFVRYDDPSLVGFWSPST